jgi:hypothetical protein
VTVDGRAVLYLERGGSSLQTLPAWDDPDTARAAATALAALLDRPEAPFRELVIGKVDGLPVGESPARAGLLDAGFVAGYRGVTLRPTRAPGPWAAAADGSDGDPRDVRRANGRGALAAARRR